MWEEVPIKFLDFQILFNKVDCDLGYDYMEEVKEIKKRVLREYYSQKNDIKKPSTKIDVNQVFSSLYLANLLFTMLSFQNKSLIKQMKPPMDFPEYELFLLCFFGLCFYRCSLVDVAKHPE